MKAKARLVRSRPVALVASSEFRPCEADDAPSRLLFLRHGESERNADRDPDAYTDGDVFQRGTDRNTDGYAHRQPNRIKRPALFFRIIAHRFENIIFACR